LINPSIDKEDFITVAGTECSEILSCDIEDESKNTEDIIHFFSKELDIYNTLRWRYEDDMQQPVDNNSNNKFQQQVCNSMY
jgi:hypothetical protein